MRLPTLMISAICLAMTVSTADAGIGLGNQQSVGGVMIAPDGSVRAATVEEQKEMAQVVRNAMQAPTGELAQATDRRVISLNGLQAALKEAHESGQHLDTETMFLAGMQRIEYVIVDQENNDILLAGPAEPWMVRPDGHVVGTETGGAVLRLDDLVTAFRSVETARNDGGIRCSIEPTAEGRLRLQNFLKNVKLRPGQNPAYLEAGMRQAFGPQQILLAGVATDSRFARTLVAADFEMKRIAMGLTQSPVAGLPSYLEIAKHQAQSSVSSPRWWMACDYDPIAHDAEGRVWKISGQGVKTLTEDDTFDKQGNVRSTGRQNPLATKWADMMTEQFEDLSRERPVFRDLRNAMDLAVVATLITQQQLDHKSGIDLSVLRGNDSQVELASYDMPKTLEPQCSFIKGRAGWTVTASGGVNLNAFAISENAVKDETLGNIAVASDSASRWWWDGE
ncbi:DUF1598 domain-containing protein [Rhodopirellula bahusiensis]|uniref:DUF1598 domain-containing protein n=2 Tax=Rhodopirellula bahusiensis TaxID=2014065 RepID=A0A2G1W5L7_9BACT|nr:DUF1598 domain-containing protein [Rhodopirellula bahusiensis]PHQ34327.1 hypothetical protein CEE69_14995 [Rhodopirellula bahusiensis]